MLITGIPTASAARNLNEWEFMIKRLKDFFGLGKPDNVATAGSL